MSVSLEFLTKQISIYLGIFILLLGVIGGLLNLIVFLSLRTFRQSSCAFFLTVMCAVCVSQLITGLLPFILNNGFAYDLTQISQFYCKFRWYLLQFSILTTFTCISLATVNQFLSTCSHPYWRQWCNIKYSRCVLSFFIFLWCLHGIPYLIFYDIRGTACSVQNTIFSRYLNVVYLPILLGALPNLITILFGILAYYNIQQLTHRNLPIIRRELDKQLTMMLLLQVIFNFFAVTPYTIWTLLTLHTNITSNPSIAADVPLIRASFTLLYYFFFASPFYIYICTSERFRRQLSYVLFKKQRIQRPVSANQIQPQN